MLTIPQIVQLAAKVEETNENILTLHQDMQDARLETSNPNSCTDLVCLVRFVHYANPHKKY